MDMWIKILILVLCLLPLENGFAKELKKERARIRGITLEMIEIDGNEQFEIYPQERSCKVDANATLKLTFIMPPKPEDLETSPEWLTLIEIIDRLKAAEIRYEQLAKRAGELQKTGAKADQVFIDETQAAQKEAVNILFLIAQPKKGIALMTREEIGDLIASDPLNPYKVLITQINKFQKELRERTKQVAEDAGKYRVIIRAFLLPRSGGRQALHIDGYDNLPEGDFRPLDPTGLLPSPQEARRLAGELEAADKVSRAIEELRRNGGLLRGEVEKMAEDIESSLSSMEIQLRLELKKLPEDFKAFFQDTFLNRLEQLRAPNNEAGQLADALREIGNDLSALQQIADSILVLRDSIRKVGSPNGIRHEDIESIFSTIDTIKSKLQAVSDHMVKWDEKLKQIASLAPHVAEVAVEETLKTQIEKLMTDFTGALDRMKTSLQARLPATANAVSVFAQYFKSSSGFINSISDLTNTQGDSIPHPLDDLLPAELDLRYAGVTLGDQVKVSVELRKEKEADFEEDIKKQLVIYQVETTHAGWHRRFSGDVIFTKAVDGPASNSFQGNIAASYEWHHYEREKPDGFLNNLDPGFGFHAALLSQDSDQNVEFGIGVNISFFDGLIRGGYGYNLSVDDNEQYWFIGFGLINALGQIQKVFVKRDALH
jgi:hypothetical protein